MYDARLLDQASEASPLHAIYEGALVALIVAGGISAHPSPHVQAFHMDVSGLGVRVSGLELRCGDWGFRNVMV